MSKSTAKGDGNVPLRIGGRDLRRDTCYSLQALCENSLLGKTARKDLSTMCQSDIATIKAGDEGTIEIGFGSKP